MVTADKKLYNSLPHGPLKNMALWVEDIPWKQGLKGTSLHCTLADALYIRINRIKGKVL